MILIVGSWIRQNSALSNHDEVLNSGEFSYEVFLFDDLDLDRDIDESFAVVVGFGSHHEVRNITGGRLGRGGDLDERPSFDQQEPRLPERSVSIRLRPVTA